jgi:glyoxylase-like metal-dependent hydrolase (beta-lactamase superfamily II)
VRARRRPTRAGPILERLVALDLRLVALLSTHGHVDHVGGVTSVVKAQDHPVPVHIHREDEHMLLDPVGSSGMLGRYLEGLDVSPPR